MKSDFVKVPGQDCEYVRIENIILFYYQAGVLSIRAIDGSSYTAQVTREQFEDFAWKVL